ncbi:DUF4383 domain-containing protein [Streptomyces sp. NPDC019990]|uniref:DUF4383 domain-containing protein n=1 Tax=Streptomyces sp. NPDC019990 TaxID=3154693 RepID=UPI0033C98251
MGVVFLLVGALGSIPGITTGHDCTAFAPHDSGAELFGIFRIPEPHTTFHLPPASRGRRPGRSGVRRRCGTRVVTSDDPPRRSGAS